MTRNALVREHPGRIDVPVLAMTAGVLLVIGLNAPLVRFESLLRDDFSYSVLSGLAKLWSNGDHLIASVIFFLSVVFPTIKLLGLLFLWFIPTHRTMRTRLLRVIEPLGKWSMLDVLVVILFAGAVKLGLIASAQTMNGAIIYAAAILISMLAATLMAVIIQPRPAVVRHPRGQSLLLPLLAGAAVALLAGGLYLPLMQVEKWIFWQEQYSILAGVRELLRSDEALLAVGFAVFVVVLPLLVQLSQFGLALVQLGGHGGGRTLDRLLEFDRWAMLDVFALALFIAGLRLSSWTSLKPLPGLWCLAAALALSTICSLWLRWLYRPTPTP